ncbi:MAG: DUF4384 domain-containing protein [Rhizobiaceae bacterium]|nr:DUF4384 domain-containing protein [Rhizobiaceae bacterium]
MAVYFLVNSQGQVSINQEWQVTLHFLLAIFACVNVMRFILERFMRKTNAYSLFIGNPGWFLLVIVALCHLYFASSAFSQDNHPEDEASGLFASKCNGCHGELESSWYSTRLILEGMDTVYSKAKDINLFDCGDIEKSKILRKVKLGEMPKDNSPLNGDEIGIIRSWIGFACENVAALGNDTLVAEVEDEGDAIKRAARESFDNNCASCHNAQSRNGGGGFYRILDLDYLASGRGPKAYVNACQPEKSLILRMIETGSMPKGRPIIGNAAYQGDIDAIKTWLTSLNASDDADNRSEDDLVTIEALMALAVNDIRTVDQRDRPFIRYLSLDAPYNAGLPSEDIALFSIALTKLVNALSMAPSLKALGEVEGSKGLLWRLNLRDYHFAGDKWDKVEQAYPYGVEPFQNVNYETLTGQTRTKLPIIKGDWFAYHASRPDLYYDLLGLPQTEEELETFVGGDDFDTAHNIREGDVVRAGFGPGESGVSFHSRLIERHKTPAGGIYWKSYDFGGQSVLQNLYETPLGPDVAGIFPAGSSLFKHDGGEIIFSLPNGMHGYYLATSAGKRLQIGPANIVHDASRVDRVIVNGLSCMSCHSSGIQTRLDNIRDRVVGRSSAKFTRRLQRVIEDLHVPNDQLQQIFKNDETAFLQTLFRIGAAKKDNGVLVPVLSADGIEPVRYLSDWYEEGLKATEVASELGLTFQQFEDAAIGNQAAAYVQANRCDSFPRESFEKDFAAIVPLVTDHASLFTQSLTRHHEIVAQKDEPVTRPIRVELTLPSTQLRIGDAFSFTVSSNRDCRYRIFTIDSLGRVEVHDPALEPLFLGSSVLRAGETRRLPLRGSARIDPPAGDLQFGIVCSLEELNDIGISNYELRDADTPARSKGISFKLNKLANRFREDVLSTNVSTLEVVE